MSYGSGQTAIRLEETEKKFPEFAELNRQSVAITERLARIPVALNAAWKTELRKVRELDRVRFNMLKQIFPNG